MHMHRYKQISKILNAIQRQAKEAHFLFVVIAVPAIAAFISMLPAGWGLDEQLHTMRSYQVSQGNLYPDPLPGTYRFGGDVPVALVDVVNYGYTESNLAPKYKPFYLRQDVRDKNTQNRLEDARVSQHTVSEYEFGATGPYSPIVYLPAAIGMYIGRNLNISVHSMIQLAKAIQALVYIAFCTLALWLLRNSRSKWLVFLIALLPSSIFLAATLNADTFTIGACLLFFACFFSAIKQRKKINKRQYLLIAVATILLMFSKPSYSVFAALLLFLPVRLFVSRKKKYLIVGSILTTAFIVLITAAAIGMPYADAILLYKDPETASRISLIGQFKWILNNPFELLVVLSTTVVDASDGWGRSIIGILGYNSIAVPHILVMILSVTLVIAGLYVKDYPKMFGWLLLGFGAVSAATVIVLLYATFNPIGSDSVGGVQGRYFIPCLPFLLFGLTRVLPVKVDMAEKVSAPIFAGVSAFALCSSLLIYSAALY